MKMHLDNQADGGNKIRALSMFIVNFAASVQQYAQVAAIFFGVYLIVEGQITQGALIGAVILGGRTMGSTLSTGKHIIQSKWSTNCIPKFIKANWKKF